MCARTHGHFEVQFSMSFMSLYMSTSEKALNIKSFSLLAKVQALTPKNFEDNATVSQLPGGLKTTIIAMSIS